MTEPQAPSIPGTTDSPINNPAEHAADPSIQTPQDQLQEIRDLVATFSTAEKVNLQTHATENAYSGDPVFDQAIELETERVSNIFEAIKAGEITADQGLRAIVVGNAELIIRANEDGLTGLKSKTGIRNALETIVRLNQRDNKPTTYLSFDLDGFKAANDQLGHDVGDQILVTVSELMNDLLRRDTDIPARAGGDEFTIVFPGADSDIGVNVGQNILKDLSTSVTEALEALGYTLNVPISLSGGVVTLYPEKVNTQERQAATQSADKLISDADETMYVAKKFLGKGKIVERIVNSDGTINFLDTSNGNKYHAQRDEKGTIIGVNPLNA